MKKLLSLIMSILLISISVVGVFSAENGEKNNDSFYVGSCVTENEHNYEREIREKKQMSSEFEVVFLREEYVKHFAQADGTIKAVVYPFPVHATSKYDSNNMQSIIRFL